MDWTFTGTALTIGDFIRMENYFNAVFAQHCWIRFDHWFDNVMFIYYLGDYGVNNTFD